MMNTRRRLCSALLAGAMLLTGLPAAAAAPAPQSAAPTGELTATLRLDYAQPLSALQNHNVRASLSLDGSSLGEVSLWDLGAGNLGGFETSLQAKNADGGEDATGWPKSLTLTVGGLPQGNYTLSFQGLGYKSYAQELALGDYSRHLTVGTGDATFTLGDINADGKVDAADRELMSRALASSDRALLPTYDFNGDEQIDAADLTYVHCSANAEGAAILADGAMLAPPVDLSALASQVKLTAGSLEDLFRQNGSGATLAIEGESLDIPIEFTSPTQMGQVRIAVPEGGGLQSGKMTVEYSDGSTEEQALASPAPEGIQALSRAGELQPIVITLGKREPVKKITITVQRTESGTVSIESIRFLKDIIPENPTSSSQVKGLSAKAGSESVSLKWRGVPNITGYRVSYWPDGEPSSVKTLDVNVPYADITGLKNLTKYWFQVTPTSGDWTGEACAPVEATPQPNQRPAPPDMVALAELDGALGVSWKASEAATFYEVYYKEKAASGSYSQSGGQLTGTSTTISGLKNGSAYNVYVVAGNSVGKSGPSRVSEGTPKALDYSAPAGLPTDALLPSSEIESIKLAWPNNYAAGEYTQAAPFDPRNMIDGNYRTHWTASNWYGNEHVICTFKNPVNLQAALWSPRLDGNYPSYLRAYSVQVWYEGEDLSKAGHLIVPDPQAGGRDDNGGTSGTDIFTWPNIPNRASIPSMKFAILPFEPVKAVKQISVAIEQAQYNLVSCSELMFMEYDPAHCLPDEISALFADELRTTLARGVTQAKIDGLRARLQGDERLYYLHVNTLLDELALAEELLAGESAGTLVEGIQSRSAAADNTAYKQSGSALQPLGVTAKAGEEVTVYAQGIPTGGEVAVYASQFNAEANAWLSQMGTLRNGRNVLTVPKIGSQNTERGGSLYLTYSGAGAENIRLHVRRATGIPVLEISNWYSLNEDKRRAAIEAYCVALNEHVAKAGLTDANKSTSILNVTEISTPTVLLSLPALAVQSTGPAGAASKAGMIYNSIQAWEDLLHICKTTQGIDKTYEQNDMQTRQNIRCMQMFSGAFMYAAGSHVGIGYGSCAGMVSGRPASMIMGGSNGLFGWGIAHEIGHNMDKLGQAEITNNIYALMAQTYDGKQNTLSSRLELSGKYPAIFNKTAAGTPGASNDVFVQLGMYWQLHLAYDGGAAPMDFYNRFFKAWKDGTYLPASISGLSYDEKVALTASGTAGKDLSEFFTRWGMRLRDSVKLELAKYSKEDRAIWYLNDQSRRVRLQNADDAKGYANQSFSAVRKPGSQKEVEVRADITVDRNIQGYEILRDGQPIAFVPRSDVQNGLVYTDFIGSGNHLAFEYSVKTYDLLGNQVGSVQQAGQVRVAYDQAIPATEYKRVTRAGDAITFQLKETASISGFKINSEIRPSSGAYTVSVTHEDKTVVARVGDFSRGNLAYNQSAAYVAYLNKPGTDETDTRVWTYDADTVTITGIPSSVSDASIQLISYAGDDVSFLEGAAGFAGRLSDDFRYGDSPDDVIKKGTLVVVGNYRGDPYYLSLKLRGKFTQTRSVVDAAGNETVETTEEVRDMAGYTVMLAEIPPNKKVSDISDGLFIFVPDVQAEAALQDATHCDGVNLLPSQMMMELSRKDDPNNPASAQRVTAQTLWTNSPGGQELPEIILN